MKEFIVSRKEGGVLTTRNQMKPKAGAARAMDLFLHTPCACIELAVNQPTSLLL